ncbi:hypothetical protein CRG98_002342 [Punica granatum]|uniref:Uncharacterized protein n=1 Tax=Punica granatum TaxID=22663 RepID=A0A2I0L9C8_PUNGR|nr:hypothetical protein CRG98_002342 [Punica granatum]
MLLVTWGDALGRVVALDWLVSPEKVGRPSNHDSPCHGRRVKTVDSNGARADLMDCLLKLGWRLPWRQSTMHGFGNTRTVLSRDGGSLLKGMNYLKSGGVFQGLNDSRTARRTPTRNPYLTCAPVIGRGTRHIGS